MERATEEIEKEKIFQMYLADRPYLEKKMSFNDYYKELTKGRNTKLDLRPKDEIMRELTGANNGTI